MIKIEDKRDCCGCWACKQACPRRCISMPEDAEGFRYPQVDTEKCIDCGLCEKVCPIINHQDIPEKKERVFVVQHRDEQILRESTSGGAFTALADYFILQGGIVFGAVYDGDFSVCHGSVEKREDLWKFRNSKYVQSIIGNSFEEAKRQLISGRKVLFSGTPCQIEGLLNYLRHDYDNLWTVDFVCRSVPSPLVLRSYIISFGVCGTLDNVKFRDKLHGYKYSAMRLKWKGGNEYHEGIDTDPYLRAFFSGISIRQSCSVCKFRPVFRRTDFTLGDCFEVGDLCKELDNDKGATRVLCHTKRAEDLVCKLDNILKFEVSFAKAVNPKREKQWKIELNPKRDDFFRDLNNPDLRPREVFEKYFPITLRTQVEKYSRLFLNGTGLYRIAKKLQRRIKNDE